MKTIFKIFFFSIMLQLTLRGLLIAQWYPQSSGTIYALKSVHFINETTGFACCYNSVLKTTNAGANWQNMNIQGNHNSLTFTDNSTGFMCSDSGKIFKTVNAGLNWIQLSSNTINNLSSVSFLNSQTGIVTGYSKTLLKTTDGGSTWNNIANFSEQIDFLASKILSENVFYTSGTDSYILKTNNSGNNWAVHTHGMPNPMFAIEFLNENTGWATGCCGMFMATTNGGANWTDEYYLTLGFTLRSLKFINSATGYTCGDNGGLYRTTNGAAWWDSTITNTDQILYSLCMVNQNTGWAVGGYGTILKTTNGGGTGYTIGINQLSTEIPSGFELYQNYPNPFNPMTNVKFQIPKSGPVNLKIYDILGNEIEILLSKQLNPGTYEVSFNASQYPSGIYYYKLNSGSYTNTKKMVLIK